jgi:hypothetical protein
MKRFCVLLCALVALVMLCQGCASPDGSDPWAEFKKDWNGDNMKMRGFSHEDQQ